MSIESFGECSNSGGPQCSSDLAAEIRRLKQQ
jgi:hypothetical protein